MKEIYIVIPAYNPNNQMKKIIKDLNKNGIKNIVVINDGSKEKYLKIFQQVESKTIILTNHQNLGKGASIKKAYKYIIENFDNCLGVINVDADGQHDVEAVIKIKKELEKNDKIVLGCRNFSVKGVPFLNKAGNKIMSYLNYKKYKINLKDTQSGLRGIPYKYLKELSEINGNRYEYEYNVLKYIQVKKIKYKEIEIKTIYLSDSKSHFKKIRDSLKILKNF